VAGVTACPATALTLCEAAAAVREAAPIDARREAAVAAAPPSDSVFMLSVRLRGEKVLSMCGIPNSRELVGSQVHPPLPFTFFLCPTTLAAVSFAIGRLPPGSNVR
jgi:hypothetical protein